MDALCPSAPHSEYRQYLSIIIVVWRRPLTHTTDQTHHRRFHCLRQHVRGPHEPCLRDSNMLWREGHISQYSEICLRATGNEILGICVLSQYGYQTDRQITAAISDYPRQYNRFTLLSRSRYSVVWVHRCDISIDGTIAPSSEIKEWIRAGYRHEQAFDKTKQALTSSPILTYYDP